MNQEGQALPNGGSQEIGTLLFSLTAFNEPRTQARMLPVPVSTWTECGKPLVTRGKSLAETSQLLPDAEMKTDPKRVCCVVAKYSSKFRFSFPCKPFISNELLFLAERWGFEPQIGY